MPNDLDTLLSAYGTFTTPEEMAASASSEAPGSIWATPATPWLFATSSFTC